MAGHLTLEAISYSYPLPGREDVPALVEVSLDLQPGETLCVAGPNGSGKSTLSQICAGLLAPTAGVVSYAGQTIEGRSDFQDLRRRVGLLFQNPEDQVFADTIEKDIAFGPMNRGIRGEQLREAVLIAADLAGLNLDELSGRSPFTLSEGEKRRVALAGLLAMQPEVLVLDEPFIGLDFDGREHLRSSLDRYREKLGATVVIVSHDLSHAWPIADRFAILAEGRLLRVEGRAGIVSGATDLSELGMHLPQWGALARKLSSMGLEILDPANPSCLAAAMVAYREASRGR